MINLGCVDINPWNSRCLSPNEPDYVVTDLDPIDEDFNKIIQTARAARKYFDTNKLPSFINTSDKTGMHRLLPCRNIDYPTARSIAEVICEGIQKLVPAITTTQVTISSRGDKLYIDPNQNDYAHTIAEPYVPRPHHIASVSTPLEWKEVNDKLHPSQFTIHNILKRLKKKGDLFKDLMNNKIAISNMKGFKE